MLTIRLMLRFKYCFPSRRNPFFLLNQRKRKGRAEAAFLQSISKAYTIETLALRLRSPTKPRKAKPRPNIAQVDGSGTPVMSIVSFAAPTKPFD